MLSSEEDKNLKTKLENKKALLGQWEDWWDRVNETANEHRSIKVFGRSETGRHGMSADREPFDELVECLGALVRQVCLPKSLLEGTLPGEPLLCETSCVH